MKERWRATGLNALLYVSPDSILRDSLRELLLDVRKNPDPRSKTNAMVVLANCKPLEGIMEVNGQSRKKDFYSECERRFIPWVEGGKYGFHLPEEDFRNKHTLAEANKAQKERMLDFEPADIRYIIVKSLEEVPKLVDFVDENFRDYANTVRKVLMTRIVSLDELLLDL